MLEVDGQQFSQSFAMFRYVGQLAGLHPDYAAEPLEALRLDQVLYAFKDWFQDNVPAFRILAGIDAGEQVSWLLFKAFNKVSGVLLHRLTTGL